MSMKKVQFSFTSTYDGSKMRNFNSWGNPKFNNFFNPNPEPKIPWYLSIVIIVVTFFIFFPISLTLMAMRASLTDNSEKAGKGLKKAGILAFMLGAMCIISGLTFADYGLEDFIAVTVMFIFSGSGVFALGVKTSRRAQRYRNYIELIINEGLTSIDNIATNMSVNYEKAIKDLQKIIDIGYFEDTYINESQREIVLPKAPFEEIEEIEDNVKQPEIKQTQVKKESEFVVINCKGCGANNKIKRYTVGECEFCGSHIGEE